MIVSTYFKTNYWIVAYLMHIFIYFDIYCMYDKTDNFSFEPRVTDDRLIRKTQRWPCNCIFHGHYYIEQKVWHVYYIKWEMGNSWPSVKMIPSSMNFHSIESKKGNDNKWHNGCSCVVELVQKYLSLSLSLKGYIKANF